MKKFKQTMRLFYFAVLLGSIISVTSCEKDESYTEDSQSVNLEVQLKVFREKLSDLAKMPVSKEETLNETPMRINSLLISDAKNLIYAKGISPEELSRQYHTDEEIIRFAMDILVNESSNQIN